MFNRFAMASTSGSGGGGGGSGMFSRNLAWKVLFTNREEPK